MTGIGEARIKVAVTDLGTGDTEEAVISYDYTIVCAGSAYVDGVQMYANGTHVITVKGRKSRLAPLSDPSTPSQPEEP